MQQTQLRVRPLGDVVEEGDDGVGGFGGGGVEEVAADAGGVELGGGGSWSVILMLGM